MYVNDNVHKAYESQRSHERRLLHKDIENTVRLDDEALSKIADSTDIENETEKRIMLELVYSIIDTKLSKRESFILYAHYLDGKTFREIAEMIGLTEDNCRMINSRAIKKVRDILHK